MGYLSTLPDGRIVKVNRTFCAWTGRPAEDLIGARFQDLLSIGGQVFHETHLSPLLRMQGAVREIALDVVRVDGSVLPCLLNAVELRDETGAPVLVRATLFEATARRRYERELLAAQRAAEESEAPVADRADGGVRPRRGHLGAGRRGGDRASTAARRCGRAVRRCCWSTRRRPATRTPVPRLRTAHADGLSDDLLDALQRRGRRASSRWSWRRGCGPCRSTTAARTRQPGVAGAMAAAGLSALVTVPVSADNRRLGVLVLGAGRRDRRPDQPRRARGRADPDAGRRRPAVDAGPPGGAGAGARAAARGDGPPGRACGVPAGGRAAAGRRRGRARDRGAAGRTGGPAAGRPLRHRPRDRRRG